MYSFHNKSYSAEQRGFHPVELYLAKVLMMIGKTNM
ncbi:DUF2787 family protein [Vibrio parahaemolyticus]